MRDRLPGPTAVVLLGVAIGLLAAAGLVVASEGAVRAVIADAAQLGFAAAGGLGCLRAALRSTLRARRGGSRWPWRAGRERCCPGSACSG